MRIQNVKRLYLVSVRLVSVCMYVYIMCVQYSFVMVAALPGHHTCYCGLCDWMFLLLSGIYIYVFYLEEESDYLEYRLINSKFHTNVSSCSVCLGVPPFSI